MNYGTPQEMIDEERSYNDTDTVGVATIEPNGCFGFVVFIIITVLALLLLIFL